MTNTANSFPANQVLGHLFGWPIREAHFFAPGQCPITDSPSTSPDYSLVQPQGHVSNTFDLRLSFFSRTFPLISSPLYGDMRAESVVDRITEYLLKAALRASTIEEKENYELASSLVLRAYRADSTADVYAIAFAWKYGTTPERAAQKIAYRRAWMLHSSTNPVALPLPPRKPIQSVKALPHTKKEVR